tara:strand:+ start:5399 stop:6139 length:741 start_codon:yes stop_codon:yes gene_type:complete
MMRWLIALAILAAPSSALAFHQVSSFSRTANSGGGNAQYFTGSKRFKGYDCSACHVGAEGRISVAFDSALSAGVYTPGLIYPITVRMIGEHRGLESAFNPNTFTVDFTDSEGNPVGLVSGGAPQIVLAAERTVAVAEGLGEGETSWDFSWWAPDVAVPMTIHIAMLDGDGADDAIRRFIDPLNDDIATFSLDVCPEDEGCETDGTANGDAEEVAPMGCSSSGRGPVSGALALLLILFVGRRRQWLR